jgi:hypothetical protein
MRAAPDCRPPPTARHRLVGCSVVSGQPLHSRAVAGVSQHVSVGLGSVLVSRAPSPPAAAAAAWRGRDGDLNMSHQCLRSDSGQVEYLT